MFAKPYKHKSNNTLKNSEKKHLAQRIQDEFPLASEENAKELVPVKASCICMKVVLHSGDIVNVYAVDGLPMLVETAEGFLPTVCALWKVPDLVPTLNIHTPVLSKLQGGAPLYLPGVALPEGGAGFSRFRRGAVLAARTQDNRAACAVGRAAMASADMLLRASGVCMDTAHVYGDQLCKDAKFNKVERPKIAPGRDDIAGDFIADITQMSIQPKQEEWPALGPSPRPPAPTIPPLQPSSPKPPSEAAPPLMDAVRADDEVVDTEAPPSEAEQIPSDMDALLRWSLLSFLKLEGKALQLPLKTNLLYKTHLQPCAPVALDIKKSTYKKFSKFLDAMQTEGLVEIREVERGVTALVAANLAHPALRSHSVPASVSERREQRDQPPERDYTPPRVREMHCVTAAVLPLLAPTKKGTALTATEVRSALTDYVSRHKLASAAGSVSVDAALAAIAGAQPQASVRWDALMACILGKMTAATEMRFADGSVTLSKTKLAPVTMSVATRSGNKKVTLVSNLESFGFRLGALAAECQAGAAASAGVTRTPGASCDQLMLQGDQTHFIAKLLIEKYGLPKKFLEGADKALNKKK